MNPAQLSREAARREPILRQIWRDSHAIRKTEGGIAFVGLIVPAAPWVFWNVGMKRLECERCGKTEAMKTPMQAGPAMLAALAEGLTPWSNEHRHCPKKEGPEMKTVRQLVAVLLAAVLAAACGDILSPTTIDSVSVVQTQSGSKADPSTAATNPATANACPIDRVEVSGPAEMLRPSSARMDATPYFKGQELTSDCAKSLPLKWTVLSPLVCELLGATATHTPEVRTLTAGLCSLMFSQGGIALDAPFDIRIK